MALTMLLVLGGVVSVVLVRLGVLPRWTIWAAASAFCLLFVALLLRGGSSCDPNAHIFMRNNYPFPITAHHLANATQALPDQILSTVQPGQRIELANSMPLDGDIDHIQIEDAKGNVLTRLNPKDKNVLCRKTAPEYVWDISVGP